MLSPIKFSLVVVASIVIAAPGCCIPGLLCNHSSPSEEVVVNNNAGQYVDSYSGGCSECSSCGCGQSASYATSGTETYMEYPSQYGDQSIMDTGSQISGEISSPTQGSFQIQDPTVQADSPYVSGSSSKGFSATNVMDVINPPANLKTPSQNALPSNLLP